MKHHDFHAIDRVSLVTDDDGRNARYEAWPGAVGPILSPTPDHILRQLHYVANAVAQGLVIVGKRRNDKPADWARRKGGRDA